jgi:hypothetical protein
MADPVRRTARLRTPIGGPKVLAAIAGYQDAMRRRTGLYPGAALDAAIQLAATDGEHGVSLPRTLVVVYRPIPSWGLIGVKLEPREAPHG